VHGANRRFWVRCYERYTEYFTGKSVLEVGSQNVNGSVRDHFTTKDYVGVDWRAGKCVDVVSLAHEMKLGRKFDVVISASMLEHDPHWDRSLESMMAHLAAEGILLLSWGAELNCVHCNDTAPDGRFHRLKAEACIREVEKLGIDVVEFHYEGNLYTRGLLKSRLPGYKDGLGEVGLVGFFRGSEAAKKYDGNRSLDPILDVDLIAAPVAKE